MRLGTSLHFLCPGLLFFVLEIRLTPPLSAALSRLSGTLSVEKIRLFFQDARIQRLKLKPSAVWRAPAGESAQARKAKASVMHSRGISEDEAYNLIRGRAMSRRVTTEEIADAVIQANDILGIKGT